MQLKSTSEMPSLIVDAVTPRPSVLETTCVVVGVVVVLAVPVLDFELLPHAAASVSASTTVSVTNIRRRFMRASPEVGQIISLD